MGLTRASARQPALGAWSARARYVPDGRSTAGLPVVLDLALDVDLLGEGGPTHKADALFPRPRKGESCRLHQANTPKMISEESPRLGSSV
jgi:hypothetical protein